MRQVAEFWECYLLKKDDGVYHDFVSGIFLHAAFACAPMSPPGVMSSVLWYPLPTTNHPDSALNLPQNDCCYEICGADGYPQGPSRGKDGDMGRPMARPRRAPPIARRPTTQQIRWA